MRPFFMAVAGLGALLGFSVPALAGEVGFRQFTSATDVRGRALDVAVWYPAETSGPPSLRGDNAAFVGQSVHPDAPALPGKHRLIVLSHGFGGHVLNQAWLAVDLAKRGYVVAALNHPGTTSQDMDKVRGAQWWERPRDVSQVIDELSENPAWSGLVTTDGVAVIGHSMGGWTAMELAGARFDAALFEANCREDRKLAACDVYRQLGTGSDAEAKAALGQDLSDTRVSAVVSLDIGLARGFDAESLSRIGIPVLVIAADGGDVGSPTERESRYLADLLPPATTVYVAIAGAAHFSFLPLCKAGAAELLEADVKGDGVVCRDAGGGDRAAIHGKVADEVARFLDTSPASK